MKKIVEFFLENALIANVIFISVFLIAIFSWIKIPKEEMPDFESTRVRIRTIYSGASAEDIEFYITKPIEEEIKEIAGIEKVSSVSATGSSTITVTMIDDYPDLREVYLDIKDAALRAELPSDAKLPTFFQFKSTQKAFLDVGFYIKDKPDLTDEDRQRLQELVLSFETQVKTLPEVSSVTRDGYLDPELHILLDPDAILENQISIQNVVSTIRANHIRVPIGVLENTDQSKVTSVNELITQEDFDNLLLTSNYAGKGVKLGDISTTKQTFEKTYSLLKVNGREGIIINLKKSHSADILNANKKTMIFLENFQKNLPDDIEIVALDDESYDVKNRLSIVASNGLIGFILIVLILLMFLDLKAGIWVSMGIPFTLSFTITSMYVMGYTINNMTLAAVIIVMGIVVDDAIIVAENISRVSQNHEGSQESLFHKIVSSTTRIMGPIFASITTTCITFVPLLFFEGWFGKFVKVLPFVITSMLVASLLESATILPAHIYSKKSQAKKKVKSWFFKYEDKYKVFLTKALRFRYLIIAGAIASSALASYIFVDKLKFVMFPREESREISLRIQAKNNTSKEEMNNYLKSVENILLDNFSLGIIGFRSGIGQSRRGGAVKYNRANMKVELLPPNERKLSTNQIIDIFRSKMQNLEGITKIDFLKSRWGSTSGATIEIQIQENDDEKRRQIAEYLAKHQEDNDVIENVEIERPIEAIEYNFKINQNALQRFDISPSAVTTSLRAFVDGAVLYSIKSTDEEVDVRLTVSKKHKVDIETLNDIKIDNGKGGYVPITRFIEVQRLNKPSNIERIDYKRTTMVYSDIKEGELQTPLDVANHYENNVFPDIIKKYPTAIISYVGEIEETRDSTSDFTMAVVMVLILIYFILVIQFKSLLAPLIIMAIIPIGMSGVIYTLIAHKMFIFGFFSIIGALGMIGVVVNDSIILIDKLIKDLPRDSSTFSSNESLFEEIAKVSSTRLRAIVLTTLTTVIGVLPTAYGIAGYDSMLAEMMLTMGWGLAIATLITLLLIPAIFSLFARRIVK